MLALVHELWIGGGIYAAGLASKLFPLLHSVLFFSIWLVTPLLTADCLAKEKRENTLGLLFLTKLNASDVVAAKALI